VRVGVTSAHKAATTGRGYLIMRRTLGFHLVKSCYGLWLPGDERGHWSSAWDDQIGYIEPHMLHDGDPVRLRMAEERMKHPPTVLDEPMTCAIAEALDHCVHQSNGDLSIAAAAIHVTHMHLLLPYSARDIDRTAKWIADQTTKAVHRRTRHQGPVWGKGKWRVFVFDMDHWRNALRYIEQHNVRKGLPERPYAWLCDPTIS